MYIGGGNGKVTSWEAKYRERFEKLRCPVFKEKNMGKKKSCQSNIPVRAEEDIYTQSVRGGMGREPNFGRGEIAVEKSKRAGVGHKCGTKMEKERKGADQEKDHKGGNQSR